VTGEFGLALVIAGVTVGLVFWRKFAALESREATAMGRTVRPASTG
jgi:hypothetical protein